MAYFQGFPGGDTTQFPNYGCANGSSGVRATRQDIFGLDVPRNFNVPNTQQWNLTVQHALGKNWVLEVGYVGTHASPSSRNAHQHSGPLSPVRRPVIVTGANCDGSVIDPVLRVP